MLPLCLCSLVKPGYQKSIISSIIQNFPRWALHQRQKLSNEYSISESWIRTPIQTTMQLIMDFIVMQNIDKFDNLPGYALPHCVYAAD